jgi:hypothetical protein
MVSITHSLFVVSLIVLLQSVILTQIDILLIDNLKKIFHKTFYVLQIPYLIYLQWSLVWGLTKEADGPSIKKVSENFQSQSIRACRSPISF